MNSPLLLAVAACLAAGLYFVLRVRLERAGAPSVASPVAPPDGQPKSNEQTPLEGERGLADWFTSVESRLDGDDAQLILKRRARFCREFPIEELITPIKNKREVDETHTQLECPHCFEEGYRFSLHVLLIEGTFHCTQCDVSGGSPEFVALVSPQLARVRSKVNRTYALGMLADEPFRMLSAARDLVFASTGSTPGSSIGKQDGPDNPGGGVRRNPGGPWRPKLPGVPQLSAACEIPDVD